MPEVKPLKIVNGKLRNFSETDQIPLVNLPPGGGGGDLTLGETSVTAYRGDRGKTAYDHSQTAHAPSGATVNSTDAQLRARSSHTGTQLASTISDFQTTVSANSDVAAMKAIIGEGISDGDSIVDTLAELLVVMQTYSEGVDLVTQLAGKAAANHNHTGVYAPILGSDDNYVTDAEKVKLGNLEGINTGDQDLSGKQDTLQSGTNIKTVNGNSLLGSGNVVISGSAAISETEIDLGATPVAEAIIQVTNAAITVNSKLLGGIAYKAPTGKDLDELEMDALEIKLEPLAGSFNVHIKGLEGYISDRFIIWYQVAA